MMNQHVHCIVSDCHYWDQGNMCKASEILVATDDFVRKQTDLVDAKMAAKLTPAAAGSSPATACKTYVTKGSKDFNADGINRMS